MRIIKRRRYYPAVEIKSFLCWDKIDNGPWHMVIRDGGVDPVLISTFLAGIGAGMALAVIAFLWLGDTCT